MYVNRFKAVFILLFCFFGLVIQCVNINDSQLAGLDPEVRHEVLFVSRRFAYCLAKKKNAVKSSAVLSKGDQFYIYRGGINLHSLTEGVDNTV